MISIQQHVRSNIENQPFMTEQLSLGHINLRAYARTLKPDIERAMGERVSLESITTALSRHCKTLTERTPSHLDQYIGDATIQTGLSILNFHASEFTSVSAKLRPQLEKLSDSYVITKGIYYGGIYAKTSVIKKLSIPDSKIARELHGMVGITVKQIGNHTVVPGVSAHVLNLLAQKGINVEETVSIKDEITVIIAEQDADLSLKTLLAAAKR